MRGELKRRCFARFLSLHFIPCLLRYVSKQPSTLSGQQAAGLPLCSLTSYHALKSYASMQPGQTVVVIGASSGTGLMGVQLAKALGAARVIGVCSGKNANLVKQMGADYVIDYSEECWWQSASLLSNKADIVCVFTMPLLCECSCLNIRACRYDCVGGVETWTHSHSVLKPWGKFVTIAGDEQAPLRPLKLLSTAAAMLGRKIGSFTGAPACVPRTCRHRALALTRLAATTSSARLIIRMSF